MLTWELAGELSAADRGVSELAGIGRTLPNPYLLIRPFMHREAVLSSRIEGTVTRLDQLFLFETVPGQLAHNDDAEEVFNYVLALELGLEAIRSGQPFTRGLLREVHKSLMQGVRGSDKRPGEFRNQGKADLGAGCSTTQQLDKIEQREDKRQHRQHPHHEK